MKLFSIVTISFNQSKFIRRCIESVLNQTYPFIEYIVIDGGSDDESVSIIEEYIDHIKYFVSCKDQGPADGLNKGFAHASGYYFGYINADDELSPFAVERAYEQFQKHKSDVVVGSIMYSSSNNRPYKLGPLSYLTQLPISSHGLLSGNVINQQGSFFKASVHRPFNISNKWMWDYEHFVDLYVHGCKFSRIFAIQGYFRFHQYSITCRYKATEIGRLSITPTTICKANINDKLYSYGNISFLFQKFPSLYRFLYFLRRTLSRCLLWALINTPFKTIFK